MARSSQPPIANLEQVLVTTSVKRRKLGDRVIRHVSLEISA